MPLPILKSSAVPATAETLLRYFLQTESNWTGTLAESEALDVGTAWTNPQLPRIWDANRVLDTNLPAGISAESAFSQVEEHFKSKGSTCFQWIMNPSAPAEQVEPLIRHLLEHGYRRSEDDLMYMGRLPSSPIGGTTEELKIIPARASFKLTQALHEEHTREWGAPEAAEAELLHLDDPHYDAWIAMKDGLAVAHVGVLASGEIGRIDQLYVSDAMRGRHIGTTMLSRALEICARSLFKHILVSVKPGDTTEIRLYEKFGFRKVATVVSYRRS